MVDHVRLGTPARRYAHGCVYSSGDLVHCLHFSATIAAVRVRTERIINAIRLPTGKNLRVVR